MMDDENALLPLKGKGIKGKAMLFMAFSALLLSAILLVAGNSVLLLADGEGVTEKYLDDAVKAAPAVVIAASVYARTEADDAVRPGERVEPSQPATEPAVRKPVSRMREYPVNTLVSRGGYAFEFARSFYVEATAYCPGTPGSGCPLDELGNAFCTGTYNDGYTASGKRAAAGDGSLENPHIIAVDPAVIPFNSLVYLDGYGFARALDRGGAIEGLRIDILFDRHAEAVQFGRRQVIVYLFPQTATPRNSGASSQ